MTLSMLEAISRTDCPSSLTRKGICARVRDVAVLGNGSEPTRPGHVGSEMKSLCPPDRNKERVPNHAVGASVGDAAGDKRHDGAQSCLCLIIPPAFYVPTHPQSGYALVVARDSPECARSASYDPLHGMEGSLPNRDSGDGGATILEKPLP